MTIILKSKIVCLISIYIAITSSDCNAGILDISPLHIDFTNLGDASEKSSWEPVQKLCISDQGLGCKNQTLSQTEGSIRTKPVPIGRSWRPASSVHVRFTLNFDSNENSIAADPTRKTATGTVYARFSPDLKHWSTWQRLPRLDQGIEKNQLTSQYRGMLSIPNCERKPYLKLISQYSQKDVPWKSDEEAATRWILSKQPDFFSKHIPFIGYIEFLIEDKLSESRRIRSLNATLGYGLNGMHTVPRNGRINAERMGSTWRFKADPTAAALENDFTK